MDRLVESSSCIPASSGHGDSFHLLETHEQDVNISAGTDGASTERCGRQFIPSLLTGLSSSFDRSSPSDLILTPRSSVRSPVSSVSCSASIQSSMIRPSFLASDVAFSSSTLSSVLAVRSPPLLTSGLAINPASTVAPPNIGGFDSSFSLRNSTLSADLLDPTCDTFSKGTKTLFHPAEESSSFAKRSTGSLLQGPTPSPVQGQTMSSFTGLTNSFTQWPTVSLIQGPTLTPVQGPTLTPVQGPTLTPVQGPAISYAQLEPTFGYDQGATSSPVLMRPSPCPDQELINRSTLSPIKGPSLSPVQAPTGTLNPVHSVQGPSSSFTLGPTTQSPSHGPTSSSSQDFAFKDLDCLENLPEVVESLSEAQRHQAAEIERQNLILQKEKERLKTEEEQLDQLQEELRHCTRQICIAEDHSAVLSQHCKKTQMDLDHVSLESLEIAKKIQEIRQKMADDARLYAEYRVKMSSHKGLVMDLESSMPIHMELAKQKEKIQALQLEKIAMEEELHVTTGGNTAKLEQEMTFLKASKAQLLNNTSDITTAITNEESGHACLKQDTDVLRKRNQAQLTRLRKQLKEAQMRNKQWHDEACQLKKQIEEQRKFIEE